MSSDLICITESAEDGAVYYLFCLYFVFWCTLLLTVGLFHANGVWTRNCLWNVGIQYGHQIVDTLVYTAHFHPCVHKFEYAKARLEKSLYNVAVDSQPKPTGLILN